MDVTPFHEDPYKLLLSEHVNPLLERLDEAFDDEDSKGIAESLREELAKKKE